MYPFTENISARVLAILDRLLNQVMVLKHRYLFNQIARQFKPRTNLDERRIRLRHALADAIMLDSTSSARVSSGTAAEHLLSMRATDIIALPRAQVLTRGKTLTTTPNARLCDIVRRSLKTVVAVPGHIALKGGSIHLLA
jgi:hypothetical protein